MCLKSTPLRLVRNKIRDSRLTGANGGLPLSAVTNFGFRNKMFWYRLSSSVSRLALSFVFGSFSWLKRAEYRSLSVLLFCAKSSKSPYPTLPNAMAHKVRNEFGSRVRAKYWSVNLCAGSRYRSDPAKMARKVTPATVASGVLASARVWIAPRHCASHPTSSCARLACWAVDC